MSVTYYGGSLFSGEIGFDGVNQVEFFPSVNCSGWYSVTGSFGELNGNVSIMQGKKTVASGTVKNGELTFNKGKDVLLDSAYEYTIVVKNSGRTPSSFELALNEVSLFTKGDNSDDWTDVKNAGAAGHVGSVGVIDAVGTVIGSEWVGYGDTIDYKAFTLDSAAKLSFTVSASDAAKFTIYALNGKTDKKGVTTYTLASKQATSLAKPKGADEYSAVTKELLLDKGTYYIAVESTNAAKGGDADYSVTLNNKSVFYSKGDNSDDDWQVAELPELVAGDEFTDWVGFGDKIDYRALAVDPNGGFYSFDLSGAEDNVKFTVYALDSKTNKLKSVKSVTATAKKPSVSTGDLCLDGATQYFLAVEAPNAAKGQNSDYTVEMTGGGRFANRSNETWDTATLCDADIDGLLTTAIGGDKLDYLDLAAVDAFNLDAGQGKVKVSFFNEQKKAVKVAQLTMADGSVKKNVSDLTLVADNKMTDSFDLAAIDDAVRYMKIEAATNGVNTYKLSLLA